VTESDSSELVVAVYLDTNVLLDLLATVEDGFALVERVTSGQTSASAAERSGGAEFGAPGMFNFFKFSGKLGRSSNKGTSETTEVERTHTYGSMLHRLRRYLVEEGLVTTFPVTETADVDTGSFVEFTGVVRPNPFTASFHRLRRMLSFVDVALAMDTTIQPAPAAGGKGRGQNQPARRAPANPQLAQLQAMKDFLDQLTLDVEREGTSTVVFESQLSGYNAVVTMFSEFLRDRSMAELLNREFRLLGKVARHLPAGSAEGVDLLASSGIAGFPPQILSQLSGAIDQMSGAGGAQVATPSTVIEPPVIEIVPIAIYL
jgi:hypothetical protein